MTHKVLCTLLLHRAVSREIRVNTALQRQTAVTAYWKSKQLLLFTIARQNNAIQTEARNLLTMRAFHVS